MNIKKNKNILFAVAAGSLILSAGVGFAAWTITGGSSRDSNRTITADPTVTDKRILITSLTTKDTIEFKPVKKVTSPNTDHKWITVVDDIPEEKLTATYKLNGTAVANQSIKVNAVLTETTTADAKYSSFVTAGVVAEAPTPSYASSLTAADDGTFSTDITVTFAWGTAFGGKNPYDYFNGQDYKKDLGDKAAEKIPLLKGLENCTFKLTVTVSDGSASN